MPLIAQVPVKSHQAGKLHVFAPGDVVTGLTPHDETELVRSGALLDTVEQGLAADAQAQQRAAALATFQAAREAELAHRDSIQSAPDAPAAEPATGAEPGVPASPAAPPPNKPAGRKAAK